MDPNLEGRGLLTAVNTKDQIDEHIKITKGKIRTRFPPEPNGYLHIGHAKSMNMNFEGAFEKLEIPKEKRETYFRYDDTNPEAESNEYINAIHENVIWLGWKPTKITYSSDYFDQLYEFAIQLIKNGKAYVCHQSKEQIEICRTILKKENAATIPNINIINENGSSPYRNRPIEENLNEFEKMKKGYYQEGETSLRLKMDLTSPNPNMWDFVAYRIKYVKHPHVGNKWCIYPTYDYTHCIVDSLEHIDYSICTLEFETRRESYYWLLDALNLYKPKVYEFARLNVTYTVLSKRKLLTLVNNHIVRGWDDPRLSTINGLRRRGFTAEILNEFCKEIGVTRVQSMIQIEKLFSVTRKILGNQCKRAMVLLNPIKVIVENYDTNEQNVRSIPYYPNDLLKENGITHDLLFTKTFFIDESDFKIEDQDNFYGLAPGKEVGLKYCFNMKCTKYTTSLENKDKIDTIYVQCDYQKKNRPKGHISWLPIQNHNKMIEIRHYDHLFNVPDITEHKDVPWETLINKNSENIFNHAMIDPYLLEASPMSSYQFERMGYYVVDKDTSNEKVIFNRIVPLRESINNLMDAEKINKIKENNSRKDIQQQQLENKIAKMKISPMDLFKNETDKYSKFDLDGIPTHDVNNEPLSKSLIKKLKKEWLKQKKLFESN